MTEEERNVARELGLNGRDVALVGSRLICGEGNDIDVLCYSQDPKLPAAHDYEPDLDVRSVDHYEGLFSSWRKGDVNLLLTTHREYFIAEATAAQAARVFREGDYDLNVRDGRVMFHAAVRRSVRHLHEALADDFDDVAQKTRPDIEDDDLLG